MDIALILNVFLTIEAVIAFMFNLYVLVSVILTKQVRILFEYKTMLVSNNLVRRKSLLYQILSGPVEVYFTERNAWKINKNCQKNYNHIARQTMKTILHFNEIIEVENCNKLFIVKLIIMFADFTPHKLPSASYQWFIYNHYPLVHHFFCTIIVLKVKHRRKLFMRLSRFYKLSLPPPCTLDSCRSPLRSILFHCIPTKVSTNKIIKNRQNAENANHLLFT